MPSRVPSSQSPPLTSDTTLGWRLLSILAAYRVVALILVVTLVIGTSLSGGATLHRGRSMLFLASAGGYLVMAVMLVVLILLRRPSHRHQALLATGSDLFFLSLLTLSAGSFAPEFALLMFVPVAVGGALFERLFPTLLLILIATAVALVQGLENARMGGWEASLPFTLILIVGLLLLPLILHTVATRLREHQSLIARRGVDVENLEALNAYLVDQIGTGVVVLDNRRHEARRINRAAEELLGGGRRELAIERLKQLRSLWEEASSGHTIEGYDGRPVAIEQHRLAPDVTLLILEDLTHIERRIHDTKLAALGRLSAAIAHEIRNPLSAIQHAGQLLRESPHLNEDDQHLLTIIQDQGRRLEGVIRTVLSLSRNDKGQAEILELSSWLEDFAEEFRSRNQLSDHEFTLRIDRDLGPYPVHADPGHLQQITWNLTENALRHGQPPSGPRWILLRLTRLAHDPPRAHLGVLDHGMGLNDDAREKLFEPFYTTTSQGTGLGLFIARELTLLHGGQLHYRRRVSGGSEFYIHFPLAL